jgi:hypothetical protein
MRPIMRPGTAVTFEEGGVLGGIDVNLEDMQPWTVTSVKFGKIAETLQHGITA